ncbi:MAG: GtrA family protein [Prevotellaceae bacterium]|jgi:putative flippase GtrA|nr:GtrA family protein [Prevotellaceae bacterium]
MRKLFEFLGAWIGTVVDFFYPPFSRYMSRQFFRYGVTGAANMAFDWVLYFVLFHCALHESNLNLTVVTLSPHIAAMLMVFPVTFVSGFLLQKYVTFTSSELRGRIQIVRYFSVVLTNLLLNYFGLKLMVDVLGFFPTPSKMGITVFCTILSYLAQKHYSFRGGIKSTLPQKN